MSQVEGLLKMVVNLKPDSPALRDLSTLTPDFKLLLRGRKSEEVKSELDVLRLKMFNFIVALMTSDQFRGLVAKVRAQSFAT